MYDKIQAALEIRAKQLVDVPHIVFDNTKYEPVVGTPFIRSHFMPMERRVRSFGLDVDGKPFRQRYNGIYQLLLNYPDSKGSGPTNTMVNEILDKFEATTDLVFQDVVVTIEKAERIRGVTEGPWFKTPVQISWYSYSK